MNIDPSWSFFLFCFCWIALIVGAVLGYLVGSYLGKRRERYRQVREKIRSNKQAINRFQQEKYAYFRQMTALQEEMESQAIESERYGEQQAEVEYYRKKLQENACMIRLLNAENTSLNAENISLKESDSLRVPGYSPVAFSLLEQMKEDPVHTNLSREDWMELISITDKLFNQFLTGLTETYALTRHEQEICCLIKWNFTRREQMALFNNTTEALTKSKGRLKKRLQLEEGTDLDQYIRLYG